MVYAKQRWDLQNTEAHKITKDNTSFKHNKLIMALKHLQAQKDNMLIEDRGLIPPNANIENMKTYQLQKFLQTIAPIVWQSKREAKKLGKRQCKLTSYFSQCAKQRHVISPATIFLPPPKCSIPKRPPPEPDSIRRKHIGTCRRMSRRSLATYRK